MKTKVRVKQGRGLMFKLVPKNLGSDNFDDAVVTLVGKSTNPSPQWFTAISGSYNSTAVDGHVIGICADATPGTYGYDIDVAGFGKLDPRVIVEQ